MKAPRLLTRDDFRESVFARDGSKCVFCGRTAEQTPEGKLDAHHIVERRLFTAPEEYGGYFIDNGATVCEDHHRQCEATTISCIEVRDAAGITRVILPEYFYHDAVYDKWGNTIMPNGTRLKGPLFHDESVQKILGVGGVLPQFTNLVKQGRTVHLPWSDGVTEDDRIIKSLAAFQGQRVIVTEKMDGQNFTFTPQTCHSRSVDGRSHPSQGRAKAIWAQVCGDIPEGWRIVGENMYAKHSIHYTDLPSYFMAFSVWNEKNICLSWDDTNEWLDLFGLERVPVLYDGIWDEKTIRAVYDYDRDYATKEGYVVRLADSFSYFEYQIKLAKMVRRNHVGSAQHWMFGQKITPNLLKR
jgi:hypothetical protein